MAKVLSGDTTGVCYNCLNGFHKGCDDNFCTCAKKDHKAWWWKDEPVLPGEGVEEAAKAYPILNEKEYYEQHPNGHYVNYMVIAQREQYAFIAGASWDAGKKENDRLKEDLRKAHVWLETLAMQLGQENPLKKK